LYFIFNYKLEIIIFREVLKHNIRSWYVYINLSFQSDVINLVFLNLFYGIRATLKSLENHTERIFWSSKFGTLQNSHEMFKSLRKLSKDFLKQDSCNMAFSKCISLQNFVWLSTPLNICETSAVFYSFWQHKFITQVLQDMFSSRVRDYKDEDIQNPHHYHLYSLMGKLVLFFFFFSNNY
jgi:hypothetical protein